VLSLNLNEVQILFSILCAFIGAIIWVHKIKNVQDRMLTDVEHIQDSLDKMKLESAHQAIEIAKLSTKMDNLHEQMNAMDRKLTRLLERQSE
jgi:hypothetical protein